LEETSKVKTKQKIKALEEEKARSELSRVLFFFIMAK